MSPPRSLAASLPLFLSMGSNWSLAARIAATASSDCVPAWVVASTRALNPPITLLSKVRSAALLARRSCVMPLALDASMALCNMISISAVLLGFQTVSASARARTIPASAPIPISLPAPVAVGALATLAPSIMAAVADNSKPSWRLADSSPRSLALAPVAAEAATGSKLSRLPGSLMFSDSTVTTTWAAATSAALSMACP